MTSVLLPIECRVCKGAGERNYKDEWITCYKCRGTGKYKVKPLEMKREERNKAAVEACLFNIKSLINDSEPINITFAKIESSISLTRKAIGGVI